MSTVILNILGGIVAAIVDVSVLVYFAFMALKPKDSEETKETKTPGQSIQQDAKNNKWSWIKHPAALIVYGLVVFDFISRAIPWWWNILTYSLYTFVVFNVGLWTLMYLLYLQTVKSKDASGKESKEDNRVASRLATIIAIVLVLLLITTAWHQIGVWWSKSNAGGSILGRTSTTNLSYGVPAEIALPIIGECESPGEPGGKQFNVDKDGKKSLVRGKVDKDDEGALQINRRLHADLIKETGIDIAKSKEDNYKFGKILYDKKGAQPWFKTQSCWEPKLASLGFGQEIRDQIEYTQILEVPVGVGVEKDIPIGFDVHWGKSEGSFVVENEKGLRAKFDPENNVFEDLPWLNKGELRGFSKRLKFMPLADKPAKVNLRFTRQ